MGPQNVCLVLPHVDTSASLVGGAGGAGLVTATGCGEACGPATMTRRVHDMRVRIRLGSLSRGGWRSTVASGRLWQELLLNRGPAWRAEHRDCSGGLVDAIRQDRELITEFLARDHPLCVDYWLYHPVVLA